MPKFPSMKAHELLQILLRKPLNYTIVRTSGSHRTLVAMGRPKVLFTFHTSKELSAREVKGVLMGQVKLTQVEALEVIK